MLSWKSIWNYLSGAKSRDGRECSEDVTENSHINIILLSEDDDVIEFIATTFARIIVRSCVFTVIVIGDAKKLLEETDLNNRATGIVLDFRHPHAKEALTQLNAQRITRRLPVVVLCNMEDRNEAWQFCFENGGRMCFIKGPMSPRELPFFFHHFCGIELHEWTVVEEQSE
jgi:response regulator RpfG family c-di-GMP phosphodiesterase